MTYNIPKPQNQNFYIKISLLSYDCLPYKCAIVQIVQTMTQYLSKKFWISVHVEEDMCKYKNISTTIKTTMSQANKINW